MKRIIFLLTSAICFTFGLAIAQKSITTSNFTGEVKKVGNYVWFYKEIISDSLLCEPAAGKECTIGKSTLYKANIYFLKDSHVGNMTIERLSGLNKDNWIPDKLDAKTDILKSFDRQGAFRYGVTQGSYFEPKIDKVKGWIYSIPIIEDIQKHFNWMLLGIIMFLCSLVFFWLTAYHFNADSDRRFLSLLLSFLFLCAAFVSLLNDSMSMYGIKFPLDLFLLSVYAIVMFTSFMEGFNKHKLIVYSGFFFAGCLLYQTFNDYLILYYPLALLLILLSLEFAAAQKKKILIYQKS